MQYLYRAYGPKNELLYVGISGNWSERLHSHEKTSEWIEQADVVTLERFADRESVEVAERHAIETEGPLYNKRFNVRFESKWDHFKKLRFWVFSDAPVDEIHAPLVKLMKERLQGLPPQLNLRRHQSIFTAWAFICNIDWACLEINPPLVCRNCDAVSHDKQTKNYYVNAEDRIFDARNGERF